MTFGSIAQLGEHLPYKQRVIGSSPIVSTTPADGNIAQRTVLLNKPCTIAVLKNQSDAHVSDYGPVVQLVRTLACHARGQGFESPSGRHLLFLERKSKQKELPKWCGDNNIRYFPLILRKTKARGFSSFGRARPCQGRGGGFEPRNPLHSRKACGDVAKW